MADKGMPIDYRSPDPAGRRGSWAAFRAWVRGPWGQLVVYLLAFFVLGFGVAAFFGWLRGPARAKYVPWDAPVPGNSR